MHTPPRLRERGRSLLPEYLEMYLNTRSKTLLASFDLGSRITGQMQSQGFDAMCVVLYRCRMKLNHLLRLIQKLTDVSRRPEGEYYLIVGPCMRVRW
jgi:hypothetical protein